jgi:hypothetical protein
VTTNGVLTETRSTGSPGHGRQRLVLRREHPRAGRRPHLDDRRHLRWGRRQRGTEMFWKRTPRSATSIGGSSTDNAEDFAEVVGQATRLCRTAPSRTAEHPRDDAARADLHEHKFYAAGVGTCSKPTRTPARTELIRSRRGSSSGSTEAPVLARDSGSAQGACLSFASMPLSNHPGSRQMGMVRPMALACKLVNFGAVEKLRPACSIADEVGQRVSARIQVLLPTRCHPASPPPSCGAGVLGLPGDFPRRPRTGSPSPKTPSARIDFPVLIHSAIDARRFGPFFA